MSGNLLEQVSSLYKPTSMRWLPKPKTNLYPKTDDTVGIFQNIRDNHPHIEVLLGLLETSIPPFLAPKYHCVNIQELVKGALDSDSILGYPFTNICTWFMLHTHTFGLPYLHKIHDDCTKLVKSENTSKESIEIFTERAKTLQCVGQVCKVDSAPKQKDCAKSSMDFLLEPSVLIQLAWNTVLLHQWLVAALTEVLTFEKYTLELRHWPVVVQVEPVARQLLVLVRDLKNRILLGLMIMRQQVLDYPKVDPRHPAWILDEVVLPSLASLQFINPVTGNAHEIVKSIKILSWAQLEHLSTSKRLYVAKEAYTTLASLEEHFLYSFQNICCWRVLPIGPYYVGRTSHKNIQIADLVQEVNNRKCVEASQTFEENIHKCHSLEECASIKVVKQGIHFQNEPRFKKIVTAKGRHEYILNFIREHITGKNRLPGVDFCVFDNLWTQYFQYHPNKDMLFDFANVFGATVGHALVYLDLKTYLIEFEKETGLIPQIVLLGVESVAREQIIRSTGHLATLLSCTPVDINVKKDKAPAMEVSAMLKCLKDVQENKKDRNWLWSQFPAQWRTPVNLREPEMKLPLGDENMVQKLEDRIGRIIVNAAEKSFKIYEQGGEVFPHWTTVQYIMPSLVALFIQHINLHPNNKPKIVPLLNALMHYYENEYEAWQSNVTPRKILSTNKQTLAQLNWEVKELAHEVNHIMVELASVTLVYFHQNVLIISELNMFKALWVPISEWYVTLVTFLNATTGFEFVKNWFTKALTVARVIQEVSSQVFDLQNSVALTKFEGYNQLYLSYKLVNCITRIWQNAEHLLADDDKNSSDMHRAMVIVQLHAHHVKLMEWRFQLFKVLFYPEKFSHHQYHDILKTGKSVLLQYYQDMKSFHKTYCSDLKLSLKYLPKMTSEEKSDFDLFLNHSFDAVDSKLSFLFESNHTKSSKVATAKTNKVEATKVKSVQLVKKSNGGKAKIAGAKNEAEVTKVESEQLVKKSNVEKTKIAKTTEAEATKVQSMSNKASGADNTKSGPESASVKKCRKCRKLEGKKKLVVCAKCLEDKYPDVNYFCSKKCEEIWWKQEHMAEHLEFDLGLLDFSKVSVK